jgi:hypothetical protein
VFCVHDADAAGGMIYQTLQQATKARGARKIKIVNLGLEPWEAIAMGLEVEDVERGKRDQAVADYVKARHDDEDWEGWLQTHRIELNAMTTRRFIGWLDNKMDEHGCGKLVPPADVITAELRSTIEEKLRVAITDRVLREAGIDDQIAAGIAAIEMPGPDAIEGGIRALFQAEPQREWRDHVEAIALSLVGSDDGDDGTGP